MLQKKLIPLYFLGMAMLLAIYMPGVDQVLKLGAAVILLLVLSTLAFISRQHNPLARSTESIRKQYHRIDADDYFCIALEYRNSGKYHSILDLHFDMSYHDAFFLNLRSLFGKKNVFSIEPNQAIIITRFIEPEADQDTRLREMETITREIAVRFTCLLETLPVDNRHFIKLTMGTASMGVKKEYTSVYDLIRLAQFTKLIAHEQHVPFLISDELIRSLKTDIDDFTLSMEESFRLDEFNPFFQPVIDLEKGKIIGCESFVRWQKNSYRVIEAHKFTEIANEKNLLKDIDFRVINKTFHFIWFLNSKELIDSDFITMVNISANTLRNLRISDIRELAHRYGLEPSNIEFDIKDGPLTDRAIVTAISALKDAGFRVAIDMFDSENFALNAFLFNTFDTVKINKSVLSESVGFQDKDAQNGYSATTANSSPSLETGQKDGDGTDSGMLPQVSPVDQYEREFQFYKVIINAARSMQLKKMLKGIEHRSHLEFARRLNVDYVQGYYFTPPLEQHKFAEYIKKYRDGLVV